MFPYLPCFLFLSCRWPGQSKSPINCSRPPLFLSGHCIEKKREKESSPSACSDFGGQCHSSLRTQPSNVPRFLYRLIAVEIKSTVVLLSPARPPVSSEDCPSRSTTSTLPLPPSHLSLHWRSSWHLTGTCLSSCSPRLMLRLEKNSIAVPSSAQQNHMENGRMFHGYRRGLYMYPCDEVRTSPSTTSPGRTSLSSQSSYL